jgi:prepilin-type N-terminal cleavage/methylation domain-containing protein
MNIETKISNFSAISRATSSLGFTLVELLVVIFIMVTISSISVANFRQGEKRKRAVIAADTIVAALRTGQNYALSGKQTNNSDPACRTAQYYYVRVNYIGGVTLRAVNNCGGQELIESFDLPSGMQFKANGLVLDGASVATVRLQIYFLAPFGNVMAGIDTVSDMAAFNTAAITIETTDGTINRTIIVDGVVGRIGE